MLQQKSATMDGAASSFPPRGSLAEGGGASTTSTLLSTSSSKRGSSKVNRTKSLKLNVGGQMVVSGGSSEPDSPSVVNVPIVKEKSKIRDKLRKFFLRRPNMEDLMKRGIMKNEPVFGSTLVILSKVRQIIYFVVFQFYWYKNKMFLFNSQILKEVLDFITMVLMLCKDSIEYLENFRGRDFKNKKGNYWCVF